MWLALIKVGYTQLRIPRDHLSDRGQVILQPHLVTYYDIYRCNFFTTKPPIKNPTLPMILALVGARA